METRTNMYEDLRGKLNEESNSYKSLLKYTADKALIQNEFQTKRWQDYRREHEELSTHLLFLRDKLSHNIMVPLGKKALMRGKLVHTNELLVCLGDGWFVKQSVTQATEICQRRIQHCDEILNKLLKEGELLMSQKSFTFESEAFVGEETQEVIEPYDDEKEKKWRERHRQKEKEYHQKLAELKKTQNDKIETEEDLWSRLDALDLQEELEDELNRMNEDIAVEENGTEESEDYESQTDSDEESYTGQSDEVSQSHKNMAMKRRVSFKEDKDNENSREDIDSGTSVDSSARIVFNHSNISSAVPSQSEDKIISPADIYLHFIRERMPKSILKPVSLIEPSFLESAKKDITRQIKVKQKPSEPIVKAVGEVVERTPTISSIPSSERRVSHFKAARMANQK